MLPRPAAGGRVSRNLIAGKRLFLELDRILTNRHDNAHAAPTAKAEDLDDAAAPSSALPLCNGANGCYPARRRRRLSASPFTR